MELQQLSVRSFLIVAHSVRTVQGGSDMISKRNWFIAAAIGLMLATTGCGSPTPSCGDGTVDPDEGCDPPDGVFCDDECQAIDPCAVAGVCDDGNECTADSCTADPSDNTAICETPNLPDGTACDGGSAVCAAGQCGVCGDGTVDPGEECDPPDGVFCDAQCQAIDPCAVAGVCDDGNECTADSCTADPSDNTATCENPNLPDGTACNGGNGECADGQCVVCGDGAIGPGEECDPPDGVFCDAECQAIDPCAAPGVCDDRNECTANNCTADSSDNTAICENPNLLNDTPCNGPGGACADGQCVVPNAPVLTGIETALITLNECGLPGSTFEYKVDYTDPDGDVTSDGTRVFVYGLFSNGPTFSYESPSYVNIVSGNGSTGSVSAFNCLQFGPASWADITITIHDAIGHVSNSMTVRLPKPAGAE
jgi:hypothetical protein